jgi:negative regulator of sigma E activity
MERSAPWFAFGVCVLAAGGLWFYRASHTSGAVSSDARELVQEAWTNGRRVALSGEQLTSVAGAKDPLKTHVLYSREGSIRIEYQNEPLKGVTIWENAGRTYRYNPRMKRLTVAQRRGTPEDRERQERQLLENYTPKIVGTALIADRKATVVELRSKNHADRFKRVWIDPQTSVVLGSEDLEGRNLLRSTKFTRVEFLPSGKEPAETEFRPSDDLLAKYGTARPGDTSTRFKPEQLSKLVGFNVHEPKAVPKGYVLQGAYQLPCLCGKRHQAARLEYSDGLNTLSLFECGHPECTAAVTRPKKARSPLAFSLAKGHFYYLAVGDAPRDDMEKIVRSAAE